MAGKPRAFAESNAKPNAWRWIWPALASAVLYSLAFPPINLGLIIFVALVPWLNALRGMTGRQARWSGFVFGSAFWLYQMIWLLPFVGKWTSYTMAVIPWLLCPILGAWYFALAGWLMGRCLTGGCSWLVPLVFAAIEAMRSYFPLLAFPWGLAGTPLWIYTPLIQSAAFGTVFFVSAWVVLVNMVVANLFMKSEPRATVQMGIVAVAVLFLSIIRYNHAPSADRKLKVGIGQPAVDMAFLPPDEQKRRLAIVVPELADEAVAKGLDLLVLPEGLTAGGDALPPRTPFTGDPPLPTILGGQRGTAPAYQTAFAFDGKDWTFADKTRLVIFGEFVPARSIFPFLDDFRLPSGDLVAGDEIKALDVAGVRIGPIVCFEGLFPNIAQAQVDKGSRLLAVLSNDDWFMGTSAAEQLRAGSVFRAVESGLPLVRSASLGYSFAVDARGNVLNQAPLRTTRLLALEMSLPKASDAFPYRWLFPWLASAAAVYALFLRPKGATPSAASRRPRRSSA